MIKKPLHKDIVELLLADGRFSIFISSIRAAHLEEMLMGPVPCTVFAPFDAVFDKVSRKVMSSFSLDPFGNLKHLILNHIVHGKILLKYAANLPLIISLQGEILALEYGKWIKVNHAKILEGDMICGNGCIHIINELLIPEEMKKKSLIPHSISPANVA